MKYIIELDEIPNTGLYKARGANTLVFDQRGIENILKPYEEEPEVELMFSKRHMRWQMTRDEIIRILDLALEQSRADACNGCTFSNTEEWEEPCKRCKRNYRDYWRRGNSE